MKEVSEEGVFPPIMIYPSVMMHHQSGYLPELALSNEHILYNISSTLLSLRGGDGQQEVETLDSIYIRSAVGYFNNLRVPAAVLMSIIMKEMFALQNEPPVCMKRWDVENGINTSKRWRILRYTYLLLMVLAFSLETFTIFLATQVLTQLATTTRYEWLDHAGEETKKGLFRLRSSTSQYSSMVDFLLNNYEYEYATCRFHIVSGLLSFAMATALRVRYALRKYYNLSISGMCCLLTVVAGTLTYTNANSITYGGYINLGKRQLELSAKFLMAHWRNGPLSVMTTILACLTLIFAIKGFVRPSFSYFELEDEENNDKSQGGRHFKTTYK